MNVFLHAPGDLRVVELEGHETAADLLGTGEGELWLENAEEPLARETKLAELEPGAHLTRSSCRRAVATVRFNDERKTKKFPPGTTVARVFAWAAGEDGFNLPAGQRPKHTLGLCGTLTQPEKSDHLSELVDDECAVCFDLAPKERFEG
jgi:hypothetical protein